MLRSVLTIGIFVIEVTCFLHRQRPPVRQANHHLRSQLYETQTHQQWQSHVSTHPVATSALEKVMEEITGENKEENDDGDDNHNVAFLFVGQTHADDFETLVELASKRFPRLVTVLGGGVIGERVELDEPSRPCLSLLTGKLPDGAKMEFYTDTKEILSSTSGSYLLLADPWSAEIESVMTTLSQADDSVVAGGISCPQSARQPSLALDGKILEPGSILGVKFSGSIGFQTLVAQGCRPVGEGFTITQVANGNIITKLNGEPALEVLQQLANSAAPEEQEQISSGLLCGIASPGQEDYLSRQIVGFVPAAGGIAIGASVQKGDSFCFQVRDKSTAQHDLELMVQRAKTARIFEESQALPMAALQISCVARGRGLFGIPNVDITQVQELLNGGPVAGFYANGEIGPVGISGFNGSGGECFLHGFTTVAAILCEYPTDKIAQSNSLMDAWE